MIRCDQVVGELKLSVRSLLYLLRERRKTRGFFLFSNVSKQILQSDKRLRNNIKAANDKPQQLFSSRLRDSATPLSS